MDSRCFKRLAALCVSLVGLSAAHALPRLAPPLDYTRVIKGAGMVFIPYLGTNRGPIYYTEYEQVPTATMRVFELRRIIVNLFPTAHQQNLYTPFVLQNNITDAAELPLSVAEQCKPSEEIETLLAGMPDGYKPRILPGNYPILCSLSLYFLPEDEARVRNVIAQRPVIALQASLPLCSPQSVQVDVPTIVQELRTQGALQQSTSGDQTGNSWSVLYSSAVLAHQRPELFATPDPRQGWQALMKEFTIDMAAESAVLPSTKAQSPLPVCTPEPLPIRIK